ncbi:MULTISPECIES: hypothetical protein [unclassified Yoonia]|uniref:hypothetical protein n=1 Tax=unclassified Yoonia TaxID=2629118 RepID=UPI002AFEECC2|nr:MULTISPECIES: hypothetical protein [unclassified Yoonia]
MATAPNTRKIRILPALYPLLPVAGLCPLFLRAICRVGARIAIHEAEVGLCARLRLTEAAHLCEHDPSNNDIDRNWLSFKSIALTISMKFALKSGLCAL